MDYTAWKLGPFRRFYYNLAKFFVKGTPNSRAIKRSSFKPFFISQYVLRSTLLISTARSRAAVNNSSSWPVNCECSTFYVNEHCEE